MHAAATGKPLGDEALGSGNLRSAPAQIHRRVYRAGRGRLDIVDKSCRDDAAGAQGGHRLGQGSARLRQRYRRQTITADGAWCRVMIDGGNELASTPARDKHQIG